ncbi:AAA family ATPase, partial [Mycobacterium sp.]|uniref:AAA family ATPase n=1 Tax=Mycobacterium sp. TaxID=1785 RepID=UPI003F9E6AD6
EAELRDGDYFGRAVNRAARLRSLAVGGQIVCSGATAELVIDSLAEDVVLVDRGMRQLRNLARPEHVFELRLETADDGRGPVSTDAPVERPSLPVVLAGRGPFVGRGRELEHLFSAWQTALAGGTNAVLIAGEPGVGKTRLAGEWSQQAYDQGALVIYGRCDEDLGAPYQPFAEALRSLVPCLGTGRLRGLRGVEALLPLVPALTDVLPDLAAPTRADPDTERYALFDAVVALLAVASASAPVVLILDDLHWAAKPTLLLLRHLLRFGEHARVQIIGTYRSTDLDRSHPLAAMLADLHRDGTANRLALSGLDEDDVTAYVAEAGYHDEELARALASVTGGNPFFLIQALRHVDESGGVWDQSTLPQGVREAVSRRLSRLAPETNKALGAAAVVGSRFALELVERVVGDDLVDAFDEACKAGIVIEEPGGRYRFNHAIVRQSLLAELPSVRRMRLHQRIATTLENEPGADDELLAELAYHYFECAWAGNAAKAVEYCRRAADQAMARLAYEGAADLYDRALHALEEIDDELPDRDDQAADLLVARCEALLAAGDVASAAGAVSQLQAATLDSARLAAWATCFDGQLSMLIHPERLDEVEAALGTAADQLAGLDDAAGEAKAHTVRAGCLARLGRIGDCEIALDDALTAARRARDHRRVNAVLAGAPLAALWGPNPVPRAGGRCLDVVRLLRITTDSPAVEATSTRCQAVLEAFRGRAEAARRMIDSARRTVTELGLRHALLEVEQFAGIVELVADDPAAAEPHLRKAYNGFRRMGLDADTAETAALLGRTCLALDRDTEADELCTESERLAGHALKASIAWRTLRAQLLSRRNEHDEARRVAEAAVALAERTDELVDHGDACLALAVVLDAAGDTAAARVGAERAVGLYDRKGAAALAERARHIVGERTASPAAPQAPSIEPTNACVQAGSQLIDAVNREAWQEVAQLLAPYVSVESRRKIVGFPRIDVPSSQWPEDMRHYLENGMVRYRHASVAVRGERLALSRLVIGTADLSSDAPQDEMLHLAGLDEEGRIELQVWFDVEDIDAALAELDAAHARLEREQAPARHLENAATRAFDRLRSYFAARDWDAMVDTLVDDLCSDDRRRVVNAGLLQGRDSLIENLQSAADLGITHVTSDAIATRGDRLVLTRARYSHSDEKLEPFHADLLQIVEIDADERIAALITLDLDDFDGALEELDRRYLAGEGAPYADTWLGIGEAYAALNRPHELFATTPDWVGIDHRRGTTVPPGDIAADIRANWDVAPNLRRSIEAVHRLNNLGAVVTHTAFGTSHEGFGAEWRLVALVTCSSNRISRCEVFDEADLDDALARFDELSRPMRRPENAASRIAEHFLAAFAASDWDSMTGMLADNFSNDDRRRVVGAGVRHGREAQIADMQAVADLWTTNSTLMAVATRGDRLALLHFRFWDLDQGSEAFPTEALGILEINAAERMVAIVSFDLDDFEAAIAELDARYLAGEAAAHAHTWSLVAAAYACYNRRELPATTPDWVNVDRRRMTMYTPGDVFKYVRGGWNYISDISFRIEAVHQLSNLGAVVTQAGRGTSQEGFDAEWRGIHLITVEGDLFNRSEMFDEADLDAAIARFEQLSRPAPRLENTASRANARFVACVTARLWDAIAPILADDHYSDDRRRVTGAGIRRGRDADIENIRVVADLGANITAEVIATRGDRLALTHTRVSFDQQPQGFLAEALVLVEIDLDGRIAATIIFDLEDFDAAIAELDARYLAGEAAAHAHTWSAISRAYAAMNRNEFPPTTPNWENLDHRRARAFAPGDAAAYVHATWDLLSPHFNMYIEVVHRLSNLGVVVTRVSRGTSQQGFDAEWREVCVSTAEGDLINHSEIFDEADLDAALAMFDQLSRSAPRPENAASQAAERLRRCFAARDWDGLAEVLAEDVLADDRRRIVGTGIRRGRKDNVADIRAGADVGTEDITSTVIATRGERVSLDLARFSANDSQPESLSVELLRVLEVDSHNQITCCLMFDPDDFDAAFAELDTRYLAGEAAAHARAWSVITGTYASFNRQEYTGADWSVIDHRRGALFASSNLTASIRGIWDLTADLNIRIEKVHRLSSVGAVVTHTSHGTSPEGLDAEWRMIQLLTVEGDRINGCELFDEADLDTALARFDELQPQLPRLENTASQAAERFLAHFASRDWDAMAGTLAENFSSDDRRRVVGAGVQHGRNTQIGIMRVIADVALTNVTTTYIATRGERLALTRARFSDRDQGPEALLTEALVIVEISADDRIVALISFDPDDFDAAFEELDARYVAGEAAAHARTWSVIAGGYAALNRHQIPATAADYIIIDHQLHNEATGITDYLDATWKLTPDLRMYVEAVHRLRKPAAVVTLVVYGTSQEGLEVEWRLVELLTMDGDVRSRCEVFNEKDLDTAIAWFDQLSRPAPRLENAASQVTARFLARFEARDWDAMVALLADDISTDDRRRLAGAGVLRGREPNIANMRTVADVATDDLTSTTIATRGERLALSRVHSPAFQTDVLNVVEMDTDLRIIAVVSFDPDDFDAALAELDARYLAGDAAAHPHAWSIVAGSYAALNRHEMPLTTPDCVNIDHRRETAFGPGDLTAYQNAGLDLEQDINVFVAEVHRLSSLGGVITYAAHETSQEGFDAEWRGIAVLTVEGDMVNRCEVFDEADLDAALTRFEELHPQTRRLENAASQVAERFLAHFAACDWDAMAEILADNFSSDDRRRVVGAGVRHGRDAWIVDMRATADLGITNVTSSVVATRGGRLVLMRGRFSDRDQVPEAYPTGFVGIVEINADERIAALVSFDLDDTDAAFEELDTRYLAGEAAPYARVWQLGMNTIGELNRHERGPMIGRFVYADHRRIPFASGEEFGRGVEELWALVPDARYWTKAVHALDALGTVVTLVIEGTDAHGSELQWGRIILFGSEEPRVEVYEEEDVDAALARFEELRPQATRLENTASQVVERFWKYFGAREWAAMAELVAHDIATDDRRRVVNAGIRRGRDDHMADMRAIAEVLPDEDITSTVIATRGARLALTRICGSNRGMGAGEVSAEILSIDEIDADNRIVARVGFDLDDIDAAFAELEARYLAGEAAAHAQTWARVTRAYEALNSRQLPDTTVHWVNIDHRRLAPIPSGDLGRYLLATWALSPRSGIRIEAVHRLSEVGAVVTQVVKGTSHQGFDAEWRTIDLSTYDGDKLNRCELFDEEDLDTALARFDELQPQVPRLENAATRVIESYLADFATRDWADIAQTVADDFYVDDRRRVANAGIRHGRDAEVQNLRATADVGLTLTISGVIATRGDRLALSRLQASGPEGRLDWVQLEGFLIVEIDADQLLRASVMFDLEDMDAAFEELDARYLAGEAAAHSQTWSVIRKAYAAVNRHELPPTTSGWVNIDHRRARAFVPGDMESYLHATWDLTEDVKVYIDSVHRLGDLGAVVTHTAFGTSREGFDAEWREVIMSTVDGEMVDCCEIFDEAELDAALARFDELDGRAPLLNNAATRIWPRIADAFNRHDMEGFLALTSANGRVEDRRRGLRAAHEGSERQKAAHVLFKAPESWRMEVEPVAIRGSRLSLVRQTYRDTADSVRSVTVDLLTVLEVDGDGVAQDFVNFDPDDINGAMAELTDRWLASGEVAHPSVVEALQQLNAIINRHQFDELATRLAGATFVNHRQLGNEGADTIADYLLAIRTGESLVPNFRVELAEILTHSVVGAVAHAVVKGTSTDGVAIEIPLTQIVLVKGDRVTHIESYDHEQRDLALARFQELNRPT